MIHKAINGNFRKMYLCNQAVNVTEGKYSYSWDDVDCKNCLKQKPAFETYVTVKDLVVKLLDSHMRGRVYVKDEQTGEELKNVVICVDEDMSNKAGVLFG